MKWVILCISIIYQVLLAYGQSEAVSLLQDSLQDLSKNDAAYWDKSNQIANLLIDNMPFQADSIFQEVLKQTAGVYDTPFANALKGQITIKRRFGEYPVAMDYALQLQRHAEEQNDQPNIMFAMAHQGLLMSDQGLYDESLTLLRATYERALEYDYIRGISGSLHSMSAVYWYMDSISQAIELLEEALIIRQNNPYSLQKSGIQQAKTDLAFMYANTGKYEQAVEYAQSIIDSAKIENPVYPHDAINAYEALAVAYTNNSEFASAEAILSKLIPAVEQLRRKHSLEELYHTSAQLYAAKGDYKTAYDWKNKHWALKDSIAGEKAKNQIAYLNGKYDSERKQREIDKLTEKNKQGNFRQYLFGLLGLLGLALAIISYRFYQFRQQKSEERLEIERRQKKQLQSINEMKSQFLANISHEFRTPLTLILGPAEKLLEKTQNPDDERDLLWIKRNGQRLLKLINQLLDLSKIEANKLELKCSQSDIIAFGRSIVSAFESLANQKKLNINLKSNTESIYLFFDPDKMEKVLINLLSNAIKFTDEGYVSLIINNLSSNKVSLQVQDSGSGINENQLPYIFDRFFQAQQEDDKIDTGTGIGLALCKELVELHSGDIHVESKLQQGTTFTITLPKGKDHLKPEQIVIRNTTSKSEMVDDAFIIDQPADKATNDVEKSTIVIVDDNDDMRAYIIAQLQNKFNCLDAENGFEGWKLIQENIPDLVISDVMMPGMNGLELCQYIKSDFKTDHIPVILLTARIGDHHKIEGLQHQADEYLNKPFNAKELAVRIENLIQIRRKLQERFSKEIFTATSTKETTTPSKESQFVHRLSEIIESHLDDPQFDVSSLATQIGVSKTQLNRKMRAIVNKSPNQYIRFYRLMKAKQRIQEQHEMTLAEIAYETGFSSPAYFS